jgi:pimeloyl-ACP methyl ester carboxylesterase
MATFVLVPGAWLGGWCWRDVAARLRAGGHRVISATLTGLGERAHLVGPEVGLHTHVSDVVGLLHYRDLSGATLVGHSYGGTVITAVAEQVAERIRGLVYLDASVPRDGESNNDVLGPELAAQIRSAANSAGTGFVPPISVAGWGLSDATRPWVEARLTPHPLRSLEQPVRLLSEAAARLPRAFIRSSTQSALYGKLMERGREVGWYCRDVTGGHYPMLTEAEALASSLAELPL